MTARLNYIDAAPDAFKAVYALEEYVSEKSGLDRPLIHLLKLRASQINGCAYCVDMHVKEARASGLSEQWIALVSVWREASVFTPKERAFLAWVDSVTRIADTGIPDADYAGLKPHFSDEETVNLTVAIGTINIWNRLAVGFRTQHPVDLAT